MIRFEYMFIVAGVVIIYIAIRLTKSLYKTLSEKKYYLETPLLGMLCGGFVAFVGGMGIIMILMAIGCLRNF